MGCGGSLVAKDIVLTAAHCIFPRPKSGSVTIMREDLNSTDGEKINAKEFIPHPSYDDDSTNTAFDYALIVLERATTQDIKLIKLNSDENFPAPGTIAHLMGWGRTSAGGSGSDVALEVDLKVVSNDVCREAWKSPPPELNEPPTSIENFHICIHDPPRSGCMGDSGKYVKLKLVRG
jgi:trypsin